MDGKIDTVGEQRFVDFFGEQALAADFGERTVLHRVAGGGDDVFLKHVHAFEDRAEMLEEGEEGGGLRAGERGAAGADFERQGRTVRFDGGG